MRKFLIKYSDDSISVVTVIDNSSNEEIIAKCPNYQTNVAYRDIDENDIPTSYVDIKPAWEDTQPGTQIDVSHQKARDYCLDMLRQRREPELHRLDGLKIRAEELSDTALVNSILADKNTLRDCTEDLKAITDTGHNDSTILDDIKSKCALPTITN